VLIVLAVKEGCPTATEIKQSVNSILLGIYHTLPEAQYIDRII